MAEFRVSMDKAFMVEAKNFNDAYKKFKKLLEEEDLVIHEILKKGNINATK